LIKAGFLRNICSVNMTVTPHLGWDGAMIHHVHLIVNILLYALAEKPQGVTELAEALEMQQPTLSRHLKVLRERGMVIAKRQGANVIYSMGDKRIIKALDLLREVLADNLSKRSALAEAVAGNQ
jgi:ArsR family transcriptional regulator